LKKAKWYAIFMVAWGALRHYLRVKTQAGSSVKNKRIEVES
jgi:hypothetical protein